MKLYFALLAYFAVEKGFNRKVRKETKVPFVSDCSIYPISRPILTNTGYLLWGKTGATCLNYGKIDQTQKHVGYNEGYRRPAARR